MTAEKLNFFGYCQATWIVVRNSEGIWEEFSSLIFFIVTARCLERDLRKS